MSGEVNGKNMGCEVISGKGGDGEIVNGEGGGWRVGGHKRMCRQKSSIFI